MRLTYGGSRDSDVLRVPTELVNVRSWLPISTVGSATDLPRDGSVSARTLAPIPPSYVAGNRNGAPFFKFRVQQSGADCSAGGTVTRAVEIQ